METGAAKSCDIGVQTASHVTSSRSPILDHKPYNSEDSNRDWNFLEMEVPAQTGRDRTGRQRSAKARPQGTSNPNASSPGEDGYCSQEEGNDWDNDQSYTSPLKNAPSYQTYLTLVPDLEGDSEPEPSSGDDFASSSTTTTTISDQSPIRQVSDDQAGGRGDSAPLFEQSPASTPSELASPTNENLSIDDAERERLRTELAEVELDIEALRQTLRAKEIKSKEIRHKLGITPVAVLRNDMKTGWSKFQQSSAYSKTKTGFQSAGQKTGAAFTSLGTAVTKKLGEVRDSNAFKSFEEKVSTTATTLKTKVTGTKEEDESSFEDVLQSTANQRTPDPQPEQPLPEEKVPM